MLVQINTGRSIDGHSTLTQRLEDSVKGSLERFSDRITRVEVHLRDENSANKAGADDKRCRMEARLAGLRPIVVTHRAATVEQAVDGAAAKLTRSVERVLARQSGR